MNSALYIGKVWHGRFVPTIHQFTYRIFLFWLDLEELHSVQQKVSGFSMQRWRPFRFNRGDYLGDPDEPLQVSVLNKISQLAGQPLQGKVFLLGQVRMFGIYFSPVNFYYLQQQHGQFSHLLAEVSNTPWNQRHYYLVDLNEQHSQPKAFHVSPFNPMDMQYQWDIRQPGQTLKLSMKCVKQTTHFAASINLQRMQLNSKNLLRVLMKIPSMTVTTVGGIYWQAVKLWVKGNPVYDHPDNKGKDKQC